MVNYKMKERVLRIIPRLALSAVLYLWAASGLSAMAESPDAASSNADAALAKLNQQIATGFRISPVRLAINGRSWTAVGLGSYLVNGAGGCSDCHSNPSFVTGGNPYLGEPKHVNSARYLAGGQGFGPGVVSSNITPDSNGRPAGLTLAQFKHVMRSGEDPHDPGTLLQVMPWPTYQNMTDFDLTAIYTYLQTIPSRPNNY